MKYILYALMFVSFSAIAADAYVDPNGSDANPCTLTSKCKTPERGASMAGDRGVVYIGAGSYYNVAINVVHSDFLTFIGDCNNPSSVVLYTAPAGMVLWVQDHATAIIQCVKFATTGNGSVAIAARQFAIVDWKDVVFGHFPLGNHIVLNEMSKGNCIGNIGITGDAVTHLMVAGMSTGTLQCNMTFSNSPTINYIVTAQELSLAIANLATFSGSVTISNNSYAVDTSLLKKGSVTIPGPAGTNSNGWIQ